MNISQNKEIKIFNTEIPIKSNKNNSFLIFFDLESDYLLIQARKKDDYFNKSFSNKFTLEKIRENKYFSLFVGLKEIYDEIKEIIKIKEIKIIEEETNLILSLSLPNIKTKEIIFELVKEKNTVRDIFNEISKVFETHKKYINNILEVHKRDIDEIKVENNVLKEMNTYMENLLKNFATNSNKEINALKEIISEQAKEIKELKEIQLIQAKEINYWREIQFDNENKMNEFKNNKEISNKILFNIDLLKNNFYKFEDEIVEIKQMALMNNNEINELKKISSNKINQFEIIEKEDISIITQVEKKDNKLNIVIDNKKNQNEIKENNQTNIILEKKINDDNNLKQFPSNIKENIDKNNINELEINNNVIKVQSNKSSKNEIPYLFNNNLNYLTEIYNISKYPLPKKFKIILNFTSVSEIRIGITFDENIIKEKVDENQPLYKIYYISEDLNQFYDLDNGWRNNIFKWNGEKLKKGDNLELTFLEGNLSYSVNGQKIDGTMKLKDYDKKDIYLLIHRRNKLSNCQIVSIEEI